MNGMDEMDWQFIYGRRVDVVYWRVYREWFLLLLNTTSNVNERNKNILWTFFSVPLKHKRHYTACQSLQSLQYVHHSDLKFIFFFIIFVCFGIFDSDLEAKYVWICRMYDLDTTFDIFVLFYPLTIWNSRSSTMLASYNKSRLFSSDNDDHIPPTRVQKS